MDKREVLPGGTRLRFPGMECMVEKDLGRGSSVIAYVGSYADHQNPKLFHRVLIRELFPYDPGGGILRGADGTVCVDGSARFVYELNRLSFLRGNDIHLKLLQEIPADIDLNINTFEANGTLYSLLGYTGGRTLEQDLEKEGRRLFSKDATFAPLLRILRVIKEALGVLEAFHKAGCLHLDISPDNILLVGEGDKERVTLIDYNSVHTIGEINSGGSVYFSIKEGFTAPEARMGKGNQIGEWTDLYSMTAVLYRCLSGLRLTAMQAAGISDPSKALTGSPLLKGCPETAISMLGRILKRGLAVTPKRRYRKAAQMRADIAELEERILRRGITRSSLWEAGRERIRNALMENPALDYVRKDERIYPIFAQTEDGNRISLLKEKWFLDFSENSLMDQGEKAESGIRGPGSGVLKPVLLLGGGGMGKTTALLRIGYRQNARYTEDSSIYYYISLYGYREGDQNYICDRLLESLRYSDTWESARQELMRLLDRPLPERAGALSARHLQKRSGTISDPEEGYSDMRPAVFLLLDGLNEAAGDTASLLEEIHRLAALSGVQIILTSRSDPGDALFRRLTLCRLEQIMVRSILSAEEVLPPENMEVLDLLSFPILLSMYIRTVRDGGRQLHLNSRDQLLEDYFNAILEKEKRDLPGDSAEFMGVMAAVKYLLPEIAARTAEKKRALDGKEMLPVVETCYKELSRRAITAVFPEWIGHSLELCFGTKTADEFYGRAVLEILWKRLGLLVRDEQGKFRILHQMLEEYLAEESRHIHSKLDPEKRRLRAWNAFIALCILFLAVSGVAAYGVFKNIQLRQREQQILKKDSENLVYLSRMAMEQGKRYEALRAALEALPSEDMDRPFLNEAEKALVSSLHVYEELNYTVDGCIDLPISIQTQTLSQDGTRMVILDGFNSLRCFNTITGEEIWSSTMDYFPSDYPPVLEVFDDPDCILWLVDGDIRMFSLSTGECLWKGKSYCDNYLMTEDGSLILALEYVSKGFQQGDSFGVSRKGSDKEIDTGEDSCQFIWVDPESGIVLKAGNTFAYDHSDSPGRKFGREGTFCLKERIEFIEICPSWRDESIVLKRMDIESGKISVAARSPAYGEAEMEDGQITNATVKSFPPDKNSKDNGGLFFCMRAQDADYQYYYHVGFLEEGKKEWTFYETVRCSEKEYCGLAPCVVRAPGDRFAVIGYNEILFLGKDGKVDETKRQTETVYCRSISSDGILLVMEDGTARFITGEADLSVRISDERIREAVGTGKVGWSRIEDRANLFPGDGKSDSAPLCFTTKTKNDRVYIARLNGDSNGRTVTVAGLDKGRGSLIDETGKNFYVMPDKKSLLILCYTPTEQHDLAVNIEGFIYQLDTMEEARHFSFTIPKAGSLFTGFFKDGSGLVFQDHVYDLDREALLPVDSRGPMDQKPDIIPVRSQYIQVGESRKWVDKESGFGSYVNAQDQPPDTVHWIINGEDHQVSMIFGKENILDHRAVYTYSVRGDCGEFLSESDFVTGKNGLMAVRCSDLEKEDDGSRQAGFMMVYSLDSGEWEKIEFPFETDIDVSEAPFLTMAENHKWIAMGGMDHAIWIYDSKNRNFKRISCQNLDYNSVQNMSFIDDDKYLLCWQDYSFLVLDIQKEKLVFFRNMFEDLDEKVLSGEYFEEESEIFLFGNKGFCLDKESWEIRCDISHLAAVTEERVVTQNKDCVASYPRYSLKELIRMGNEVLYGEIGSWRRD